MRARAFSRFSHELGEIIFGCVKERGIFFRVCGLLQIAIVEWVDVLLFGWNIVTM